MTSCAKCRKRIAKRACPALGSSLCHLCCGLLRDKEIHCPSSCPHLSRHRVYQEKRILEKKSSAVAAGSRLEDDLLNDERMAWLVFQIETPIKIIADQSPSLTDGEVILALEYAKEKIEKGTPRLLVLPGTAFAPKNDLGEAVLQAAEEARWKAPIILSSGLETFKREEKLRCLDWIIRTAKALARRDFEGQAYLGNLAQRFARIHGLAQEKKLILGG